MKRWHIGGAVVAWVAAGLSSPAIASGGPWASPTYLNETGGSPTEQQRLFGGRLGVLMPRAPQGMLYLQWRLLHGLKVGAEGATLVERYHWVPASDDEGPTGWLKARGLVNGVSPSPEYLVMDDRQSVSLEYAANCYPDAMDLATATLKDRVKRFGADDPWVRAWVIGQDQVFYQCGNSSGQPLPPLAADAPTWLKADRAYQEAAWSLYAGRNREAAVRFAAISRDAHSPWQPMALYLVARSLYREMVDAPKPDSVARARTAVDALSAARPGTYGQSWAVGMRRAIDFRDRPDWLFSDLERVLASPDLTADMVVAFRDYQWLSMGLKGKPKPDLADWMSTIQVDGEVYGYDNAIGIPKASAHARARWAASHDTAWLIAALSLAHPGDIWAPALAADADKIERSDPAWLTAQYHLMRLTIDSAPAAETRARVDRILATPGLPQTERNLFSGVRVQVTNGLPDFVRFALRKPFCKAEKPAFCAGDDIAEGDQTLAKGANGWVGFGEEARAIIDRMPLDTRIALSHSPMLPQSLRLDVAMTNFPRAVLLQNNAAIDVVARDLVTLLPQMASEWRGVVAAKPGEAKRFAAYFAMAKIPGIRIDMGDYTRPQGAIRQFQGYWVEWLVVPKRSAIAPQFAETSSYSADGLSLYNRADDLTCRGKCGQGAFPVHLPGFVDAQRMRVFSERAAFAFRTPNYGGYASADRGSFPKGTVSVWEDLFAYARDHPRDARSPEALYWLNRITRRGANPDGLSKRAFMLLHHRYPGSDWTRRAPYYFE